MVKKINIPKDNNIIKVPIDEAMPDNYLPYAVEVSKDRALPDVRDGLKPVHRRILYGAYMMKAFPDKPYYKSARIVGDILGKYHPHGDTSVYDAMVILAQNFSTRMPLIDGHGNWGSQDGDNAAAMRYTEARLTPIALEMLKDIDKGVVDMVNNYSDTEKEPAVLPARYPNLLVNGTFGIAVGLATNIPPHNLGEVIEGALACIDNPDITTKELMKYIKGPDLPTGGIIIGKNSLLSAYETGEGRVTLRAKASIEKLDNGRLGIVITEFPFRRSKAKLLQNISEMTADKRHSKVLEPISDIRDETDRTGIRAVIEFKKSVEEDTAEKVLKYLFKKTDLQCNLSFNMVALANGKPETMGLKTILTHYVSHQKDVVIRRTKKELEVAEKRFQIVEGFIKAIDIMDEIIETIRSSKSKKDAQNNLITKFGFTEVQAEAILELMLYRLTGLEVKAFEKEYKELEKEIKKLKKILESENELLKVIKNELLDISQRFKEQRKTQIVEDDDKAKIDMEELIIEEDIVITMSNEGYIKRIPLKSYNRSSADVADIEYREGDYNKYVFQSNTKSLILFFTDKGNAYQVRAISIPELKWKEKGERIDNIIKGMNLSQERIVGVYSIEDIMAQKDFVFFTDRGGIKKTGIEKYNTNYSKLLALKLREDEKLLSVQLLPSEREKKFIKFKTLLGLDFIAEEPLIEAADRNIMCTQIFNMSSSDVIESVEFVDAFDYRKFVINISNNGIIRTMDSGRKRKGINVETNSLCNVLMFTEKGGVFSLPGFMLQNVGSEGIKASMFLSQEKNIKILNVFSVENYSDKIGVCFFSKKGMVKKTSLKEFESGYLYNTAYKFRSDDDELMHIDFIHEFEDEKKDILIVSKKGMCIRFDASSINPMGRIAAGVTAISLNEDDEIIYASLIGYKDKSKYILLKSSNGEEKKVMIKDIKPQNRAGRGKNIMLVVMNDAVEDVTLNE